MTYRALIVVAALAALALFAFLNWAVFNAPTVLNLGFAEVNAPLGLIMLIVTGVVSALFLVYIVFQQAGVILETRRYAKELKSHRELAGQRRVLALHRAAQLPGSRAAPHRGTGRGRPARERRAHRDDRARAAGQVGGVDAHLIGPLGEIEDKLDRALAQPRA